MKTKKVLQKSERERYKVLDDGYELHIFDTDRREIFRSIGRSEGEVSDSGMKVAPNNVEKFRKLTSELNRVDRECKTIEYFTTTSSKEYEVVYNGMHMGI